MSQMKYFNHSYLVNGKSPSFVICNLSYGEARRSTTYLEKFPKIEEPELHVYLEDFWYFIILYFSSFLKTDSGKPK